VANPGGLTAYDTATLNPIGSASVGQLTNLDQAIPSPDGKRVYISASFISGSPSNGSVFLAPGEILVLDTSTFKYTAAISVNDGMGAIALTPDGSTLVYTANYGRVHLLDTATNTVIGTIHLTPVNGDLADVAISPDGSTSYVADAQNNLLLVASLKSRTQVASIAVGQGPSPVVVRPDGSEVWVATLAGLEVVNAATLQISGTVRLPGAPSAIAFRP
jgi:DNA-binding beta-propeller fold protein YncE